MTKRLSITLEREDESAVRDFTTEGTAERQALLVWAEEHGLDATRVGSEAALLRALLRAGAESLRARALDSGYSELAATSTEEEREETRQARHRYADRTDRVHSG